MIMFDSVPTSSGISKELHQAIEAMRVKRGSIKDWMTMETALLRRIASCTNDERVWTKGEIHGCNRHYPAVLIFDQVTKSVKAYAPSGEDMAIEEHPYHLFWSNVPHIALTREVLDSEERRTIAVCDDKPNSSDV